MHIIYHTDDSFLRQAVVDFVEEWRNDSKAVHVNTSGSTGSPKSIALSKIHMEASARMTGEFLDLKKGDTALLCMSPETIAGKMMIVRALVLEMNLILAPVTSTPLKGIDEEIDFAAMVPFQVEKSLNETHEKLNTIKKLIVGGGSISNALWTRILKIPALCYQTFGMTETISHIAMRRIETSATKYKALPGIQITTSEGCLVISAPHLGIDHLATGDIVQLSDNQFNWLGRKDFVINSGGIKIHPETIEQKLGSLINTPFFSSGLPDDQFGQKHILCIQSASLNLQKTDFLAHLDKPLIPKEIYYFDSFTYTNSGKINRLETLKNIANAEKQVL